MTEAPQVKFYGIGEIDDPLFRFAVIVSKYRGKWVFCRHKLRDTWEIPGGHREAGEDILDAAKRELFEETGAKTFKITPVCAYSYGSYGMLYYADISELGDLPESEIGLIEFFEEMPEKLTYPLIQPKLMEKVKSAQNIN